MRSSAGRTRETGAGRVRALPRRGRSRALAAAAAGAVALAGCTGDAAAPRPPAEPFVALPAGGFEDELSGWRPDGPGSRMRRTQDAPFAGSDSLEVLAPGGGPAAALSRAPVVSTTSAGTTYAVRAHVRAAAGAGAYVELQELTADGRRLGATRRDLAAGAGGATAGEDPAGGWREVVVEHRAAADGSRLVLRLGAQDAGADSPVAFDGVEVRGGTGSAPAGTPGAPGAPEPAQAGGDGELLVGSNAYAGGQPYAQAVAEQERKFGGLPILRTFHDGLPPDWPGDAGATDGPVVVSFKAEPEDVVEGVHDERLRDWFAGAPRDRDVHWTFFHEPENEVRQGHFTEAEFRDAWAHLDALAEEAGNERLHATLVLTCWTLQPASGRDWRDYYAGPEVVDVLAWDCYNTDAQRGTYRTPEQMFSAAAEAAEGEGKPWGIAEFGSSIAAGDDGTERAAWLTASVEWLRQRGARFVILFDAPIGGDFQVQDPASVRAWREAVEG